MIFAADTYKEDKYPMPDRNDKGISPKEKDSPRYNMAIAQSMYHEFCAGTTYVGMGLYNEVGRNRSYAYGQQDQSIYINAFYGSTKDDTVNEVLSEKRGFARKAGGSLNFEIQSPAPRMMDALIGKLSELVNVVSVDATDKYSGAEKENAKWGAWVDKKFGEQFKTLKALMAIPNERDGFVPENLEELNLYEAEGGFKPSYATTMESLLKWGFEQSMWDEIMLEKVLSDLITVGFAAIIDTFDKKTGFVKTEYLDAHTAFVQYTNDTNYNDPDYGGHVKMVKLSELKSKGFNEEQLLSAAKKFQSQFGNGKYEDPNQTNKNFEYSGYTDKFVVPVFVVYWKDYDFVKEVSRKNAYGRTNTKEFRGISKLLPNDSVIETNIRTLRQAHWVIDTDMLYDYGRVECHARDGLAEPVLPIHMVKVHGKPIIPRLIPALDLYMNSWMKFQQAIRLATIDGIAIDMGIINNINLGGRKMNPKDVLKAYMETGKLFFSSQGMSGRHNASSMVPIQRLDGGAGKILGEQIEAMAYCVRQIEDLTGINPITMGGTPDADTGKAVSEYSIMGTSDILKNIVKKANILKSNVARNMCLRFQYAVKSGRGDAYEDIVGKTALETLKIAEGHDVKYGIRTHARPTQQDIRELKEMISLALKNGRDGKVGITEADYVRFNAMINAGESLKRVAMLLGAANRKAQREAEEKEMRFQQLNQQNAQMLAQQKSQLEAATLQMETQAKLAEEAMKGRNSVIEEAVKMGSLAWQQALTIMGVPFPNQPMGQQVQQPQAGVPVKESPIPAEQGGF